MGWLKSPLRKTLKTSFVSFLSLSELIEILEKTYHSREKASQIPRKSVVRK